MKLNECTDIDHLREMVTYLYDLLDDIDTVSDVARDNNRLYRMMVEKIQKNKSYYLESDGYDLILADETSQERPKTMYESFKSEFEDLDQEDRGC